MTIVLNSRELQDLTGYTQVPAQIRALTYMAVPYRVTPLGKVKVLRSDLPLREDRYEGKMLGPDLDAI